MLGIGRSFRLFFEKTKHVGYSVRVVSNFTATEVIGHRLEVILASHGGKMEKGWLRNSYQAQFDTLEFPGSFTSFLQQFEAFRVDDKHCHLIAKPGSSAPGEVTQRLVKILANNEGILQLSVLRKIYEAEFGKLEHDGKLSTFLRTMKELRVEGSFCSIKAGATFPPPKRKVTLFTKLAQIEQMIEQKRWLCEEEAIAIDCEGVPDKLHMLQVATDSDVFVFDGTLLGAENIGKCIYDVMKCDQVTKLFHDLHCDAAALEALAKVAHSKVNSILDTQLVMEHLTDQIDFGLNPMLRFFGKEENEEKKKVTPETSEDFYKRLEERPIKKWALEYAAQDVSCLHEVFPKITKHIDATTLSFLRQASMERYKNAAESNGSRRVRFAPQTSKLMSTEMLAVLHNDRDSTVPKATIHCESDSLLEVLPHTLKDAISDNLGRGVSLNEVVVDFGRPPVVFSNRGRTVLPSTSLDVGPLSQRFSFDETGRACLENKLHRISVLKNRKDEPVGLTFRVGRYIEDYAAPLRDLLFEDPSKSILVIGPPSSGKTSLIRDIARLLSEEFHTCVVDGNNEIAGDGDVPHHCIGFARRVMTKQRSAQAEAMIACVLNHSPESIVIDEIGSFSEANAAISCGRRGVRMVASAHGSLEGLVQNPTLNLLVGGVESVILSDSTVIGKDDAGRDQLRQGRQKKHRLERVTQPVFPLIVELKRGHPGEFWVTKDSTEAVDKILLGKSYRTERRVRDAKTGDIFLSFSS